MIFCKVEAGRCVGFTLGTDFCHFSIWIELLCFIGLTFIGYLVMKMLFDLHPIN